MRINRISGLMPPAVVHRVEWYGPEKVRGAEIPKPPEPEPPPADWAGDAQHRRVEGELQGAARQAELQPGANRDPVQQILAAARKAGLNQTEILLLKSHLTEVSREVRAEDIKFLRSTVLRSQQAQRALRCFIEMTQIAGSNPGRLSRYLAVLLVAGVAALKTRSAGVTLKSQEASAAAKALAAMSDTDFKHAMRILDSAEEPADCLNILKAIAERYDALIHPAINDLFRNMVGLPGYFLSEVETYANEILSRTGEVTPGAIGSAPQSLRPEEYLKDGFLTPDKELQSGIYGYCSAAMAQRWRKEGIKSESVVEIVDVLCTHGEELLELAGEDPDLPLDASILSSIHALQEMAAAGPALRELLAAAEPHLKSFRDLAALAVHLERILRHMN